MRPPSCASSEGARGRPPLSRCLSRFPDTGFGGSGAWRSGAAGQAWKKPLTLTLSPWERGKKAATPHQDRSDCRQRRGVLKSTLKGQDKGLRTKGCLCHTGHLELECIACLQQPQDKGAECGTSDHTDGARQPGEAPGYALLAARHHSHDEVHIGD